MARLNAIVRDDPNLGRVRWCQACGEWWPDNEHFWTYLRWKAGEPVIRKGEVIYVRQTDGATVKCKGCRTDAGFAFARMVLRRQIAPALPSVANRCEAPGFCPVILPVGRTLCHFHADPPRLMARAS